MAGGSDSGFWREGNIHREHPHSKRAQKSGSNFSNLVKGGVGRWFKEKIEEDL